GYSLVDQTKIVTAASELARNTLVHGGGGTAVIERSVNDRRKAGLRIVFTDRGPGIPDVEQALTDGWSTGNGRGLGLSGVRGRVDESNPEGGVGEGTTVTVVEWIRWRPPNGPPGRPRPSRAGSPTRSPAPPPASGAGSPRSPNGSVSRGKGSARSSSPRPRPPPTSPSTRCAGRSWCAWSATGTPRPWRSSASTTGPASPTCPAPVSTATPP